MTFATSGAYHSHSEESEGTESVSNSDGESDADGHEEGRRTGSRHNGSRKGDADQPEAALSTSGDSTSDKSASKAGHKRNISGASESNAEAEEEAKSLQEAAAAAAAMAEMGPSQAFEQAALHSSAAQGVQIGSSTGGGSSVRSRSGSRLMQGGQRGRHLQTPAERLRSQ